MLVIVLHNVSYCVMKLSKNTKGGDCSYLSKLLLWSLDIRTNLPLWFII